MRIFLIVAILLAAPGVALAGDTHSTGVPYGQAIGAITITTPTGTLIGACTPTVVNGVVVSSC